MGKINGLDSAQTQTDDNEVYGDPRSQVQYTSYCKAFSRRQSALNLIKQLHQMIKSVQKHRGMSMAILAGSPLFEGDFAVLQGQVVRRLRLLEEFAAHSSGLLGARDRENLHNAWLTICADWQDDDVIDNFELHSHFIEQLHGMIMSLCKDLESPLSSTIEEGGGATIEKPVSNSHYDKHDAKAVHYKELLQFLSRELPTMVEFIARIRGLATYAAAKGVCDINHGNKLKFAIACARESSKKVRLQAERLSGIVKPMEQTLSRLKEYELKLIFLIEMIERDLVQSDHITASSHQLFKITTDIIEVYLQVVEHGWSLVTQWEEQDLEKWLLNGTGALNDTRSIS